MRRMMLSVARLAACLLVGLPLGASAQTADPADLVRAVREARDRLDYETAEARAREVLARYDAFSPDQLVEVHTVLGVVLHARGEDAEAREQFGAALSLAPDLTLDPVLVSPKTLALFEEVRARREIPASPTAAAAPRYIVLRDRRPGAALRSVALPGWGQFHKGDRARGWAYAVGVGLAAAGAVGTHLGYTDARDRYREATTPDDIEASYDDASRLYRLRNGLGLTAALGWGVSVVDALVTGAPDTSAPRVAVRPTPGGFALRVAL